MKILVDMDGVLADFVGGVRDLFGFNEPWPIGAYDVPTAFGITPQEMWEAIDNEFDFWLNLEPLPWLDELLRMLEGCDWWISTSPSLDPLCAAQKIEWVYRFIGPNFRRYMIGPDKFLMANDETVLIDDSDSNYDKFTDAGGFAVLFPQPWNMNHHLTDRRILHTRETLEFFDAVAK